MKKSIWYFVTVSAIITLIVGILGPFCVWQLKRKIPLNIWVLDKTVPDQENEEHGGITWVLDHMKVSYPENNKLYHSEEDYYGFFPKENSQYKVRNLPQTSVAPDLIYLTDAYGVYASDGYAPIDGSEEDLIYGGITASDVSSLKYNLGNGNTIIGEFNILEESTAQTEREQLENIFGIKWSGWRGTYFKELNKGVEVPQGIISQYENITNKAWNFIGAGYVLISEEGRIEVLIEGEDINKDGMNIEFTQGFYQEFGIKKSIPYQYWFEIVSPKIGREAVANYHMELTRKGQERMNRLGLSGIFPAIIKYDSQMFHSYYFAGDFAEHSHLSANTKYEGMDSIKRVIIGSEDSSEIFYWKLYVPLMKKIIQKVARNKEEPIPKEEIKVKAMAEGKGFRVMRGDHWEDIFIKGVNLGAALPGKWFTEFPSDEEIYYEWLEQIAGMNANSIRVYTLLPPAFYQALDYYNSGHPDNTLWLFQEIWPEESPKDNDYLAKDYVENYQQEIRYVIDAIHGNAKISKRTGRAYGLYSTDVSEYVLGYLVGRELEPQEVIATNERNLHYKYYGRYISSGKEANATEGWLAKNCDFLAQYEMDQYQWQHPTAIVSWPTLDAMEHDTEWNDAGNKALEYNDSAIVDINRIDTSKELLAGFFGAYHIYPNYPDFMNEEKKYANYQDELGEFRYGGYLKEFMTIQKKYPTLVAEFGLATGMASAHNNPNGYSHGGVTEQEQGEGIVRMMKAIQRENYAGGLIFEWMDEWAKKTWSTEPYMIPYERHAFWHNAIDPEQNYGILAMDSNKPTKASYELTGSNQIEKVSLSQNEAYLYIEINLKEALELTKENLIIGLDTYDKKKGEFRIGKESKALVPFGLEFVLKFESKDNAKLLVHPGYHIYKGRYASYQSDQGEFEELFQLINKENTWKDQTTQPEIFFNGSLLNYGELTGNSYHHWIMHGNKISIRIPWQRLNFSDPSEMRVLWDETPNQNPGRDQIATRVTDGLRVSVQLTDKTETATIDILNSESVFAWNTWNEPNYHPRLKESYPIIRQYFDEISVK